MAKTFNLASLNLAKGTHSITCKAKADGYRTSAFSTAVSFRVYGITGTCVGALLDGNAEYSSTVAQGASKAISVTANGTTYKLPTSIFVNGVECASGSSTRGVTYARMSNTSGIISASNLAVDISLSVTADAITPNTIVGFTGLTNETPALTLTDAIASVPMWTTTQNGYYTNINNQLDSYFPFNEIKEFTDDSGNVFVKFPKMWIKWENNAAGIISGIKIANYQPDSSYKLPNAFNKPNSSTANAFFAIGKYEASGSTSKIYSMSGQPCLNEKTRAEIRGAARAYGTAGNYYNGYQQIDAQMWTIYNFLVMMYLRTPNLSQVYGGRSSATDTGHTWSTAAQTGSTDGVTTLCGWNTSTDCVKMLGVENPYGNLDAWLDGLVSNGSSVYSILRPVNYSDSTSGADTFTSRQTSNGFIKTLKRGSYTNNWDLAFPADATGTSPDKYIGDYYRYNASGVVFSVGGCYNNEEGAGLWATFGTRAAAEGNYGVGGRLAYRPT